MVLDRECKEIVVGSLVKWYDPQEEYRDLDRVYEVYDIIGQDDDCIVCISDDYSEAEVLPSELLVVE